MSEAVFDETPLAEYLSDAGIEDWGIEASPPPRNPSLAKASTPVFNDSGLVPLNLSESSTHMRTQRFKMALRQALNPRIGHHETSRFLEQFRYAIISSQLLEPRPLYTTWTTPSNLRRHDLLFSEKGPWDIIKLHRKYWVGGGGCVVVIATLFSWKLKKAKGSTLGHVASLYESIKSNPELSSTSDIFDTTNSTLQGMAIIVTLCVGLYLYAHSRRSLLRRLHAKGIAQMSIFVEVSKAFDGDCVRALRVLQQSEHMLQGTHPDFDQPRFDERSTTIRVGKKLRAVLSSSLHLSIEAFLDAIKDCVGMCSELDLQQYFEVYDLPTTQQDLKFVMNDDFVGFLGPDETQAAAVFGAAACYTPLNTLKQQFRKLHFLRRAFFCCLLSVGSEGTASTKELETWTVITDHLKTSTDLMQQLSQMIIKERFQPGSELRESAETVNHKPESGLVELNVIAQHIAARMDLVTNSTLDAEEQEKHTQQLKGDIERLNDLWRTYELSNSDVTPHPAALSSPDPDTSISSFPPRWSALSILSGDSSMTLRDEELYSPNTSHISFRKDPEVLEAVVMEKIRPRSTLTREERIKASKVKRTVSSTRDTFMTELTNVLERRQDAHNVSI